MSNSIIKNSRKIYTAPGGDSSIPPRVTILENNEYKVTYYEIISGTSGSITLPTGATINSGEFGLSGNSILSKINGTNKPTFESPLTSGGTVVTASLNATTGAWVTSGTYTDTSVALIYSIRIKAVNYGNLVYNNIVGDPEEIGTEKKVNKQNSLVVDGTGIKYPTVDAVNAGLATKGIGTILGTLGTTGIGSQIPYNNGTANTITGSDNFTMYNVGNATKIFLDNRSTLCDQAIIFIEGGSQASGMEYFGSGYASTQFPGANSLYRAQTLHILNGNNQDKAIVITGLPIVNYCGNVGSNPATRLDLVGLRIGTASDCHTTNLNAFTVQGKTFLGANTLALSTLHLSAGSASANSAPFQISNGTRETVARGGVMEYENNWYKTNNSLVRYGVGGTIFDFFADVTVGGAETDIFSSSLIASTFAINKDKIKAVYGGNFVTAGTQLTQLKAIFANTTIWDSTAVAPSTGTTSWKITIELMRKSATVVLYTVTLNTTGASGYVYCKSGELSGLTLTNANILKITGMSSGVGSGLGDIVGKQGSVDFKSAS